ncbi:endonuclease/exonuclease/phosphatase family protein [Boseongicola sp. H5]|uniref:endonuclease/exonuclease/phosphatase family protein n=1 Tax=Boseongicola sp. H5 TaxID=2763261 RepID=UPI001D0B0088
MLGTPSGLAAETLRLATFHTSLSRDGPGLLLADLLDEDPDTQIRATLDVLIAADADVLLLQDVDYDAAGHALTAFANLLEDRGLSYPYRVMLRPNTGQPTGLDMDGNARLGEARDAQGYGRFNGQGGMALLSRQPVDAGAVRDFSGLLWANLPGNAAADVLTAEALAIQRLASVAMWDVPVALDSGARFHILALHATPPVFDGPEDRNGLRNADELRFWQLYLEGWSPDGQPFEAGAFALMGTLNVDPGRGEGRQGPLRALLEHAALQNPAPVNMAGRSETADWDDPVPGDLRVDYILPAANLRVIASGVIWPGEEPEDGLTASTVAAASDHRLVWVDLDL